MKKIIYFTAVFLSLVSAAGAQNFAGRKKEDIKISPPDKLLNINERLEYSVDLWGVPVGKLVLRVLGVEDIGVNPCYHITAYAAPNKFFSRFYDVNYTVHTYIDKNTLVPWRFEKIRSVRDKSERTVTDFDWEKEEARVRTEGYAPYVDISPFHDPIEARTRAGNKIARGGQDVFSWLYYLRLLDIKEKGVYALNIYYIGKNWPLNIRVGEPFLKDIYKNDTHAIFKVTIDSDLNAFLLGKRKVIIFFTADSRRIPIELKFGTGIGSFRGAIKSIPDKMGRINPQPP